MGQVRPVNLFGQPGSCPRIISSLLALPQLYNLEQPFIQQNTNCLIFWP